jgi:hypothetical protein
VISQKIRASKDQKLAKTRLSQRSSPTFIAVDVDIKSLTDLAPLVSALEPVLMVTHIDKLGRRHWIHLMLYGSPRTPSGAIRQYANIFQRLPLRAKRLLKRSAKEFDIGFDGGLDMREGGSVLSTEWVLTPKDISVLERLGASVRVTLYAGASEQRAWSQTKNCRSD